MYKWPPSYVQVPAVHLPLVPFEREDAHVLGTRLRLYEFGHHGRAWLHLWRRASAVISMPRRDAPPAVSSARSRPDLGRSRPNLGGHHHELVLRRVADGVGAASDLALRHVPPHHNVHLARQQPLLWGKVRERSGKGQGKVRERSGKGQGKVPLARQQPLLWEECPPSSVKLAEIISQTRRDHQQTSPRSSANLAEIISKPHRDHQQPRRDHQQTVISVYLDAAGRGGEARAAVLVHLWKKRPPS